MDVSIIIPTWNNCERLPRTLEVISRSVVPPALEWEVVLVNNNSPDDTSRVAQEFSDRLPLLYVEEPRQGLSRARNCGLRAASGKLIVFADDDVTPQPQWLATYWSAYNEKPHGFYFGGPVVSEYEKGPPPEELLRFAPASLRGLDWGLEPRVLAAGERFLPANWACPAAALRAAGDFDTGLGLDASLGTRRIGEALDLWKRLRNCGMSGYYLPDAGVVHFVPAEKCSLRFCGGSVEANGVYWVSSDDFVPFLNSAEWPRLRSWCTNESFAVAGVPFKLFVKIASQWGRWIVSLARGREAYEEYITLRFCVGVMKGYRKKSKLS
jgi:glycosyltransferase involved in cell wall biosynthesis